MNLARPYVLDCPSCGPVQFASRAQQRKHAEECGQATRAIVRCASRVYVVSVARQSATEVEAALNMLRDELGHRRAVGELEEQVPGVWVGQAGLGDVVVDFSRVAGLGVFVCRPFAKGEIITKFGGQRLLHDEAKRREDRSKMRVVARGREAVDGAFVSAGARAVGCFVNDPTGSAYKVNAVFGDNCDIRAMRAIEVGEEVFVSYGRDYFKESLGNPVLVEYEETIVRITKQPEHSVLDDVIRLEGTSGGTIDSIGQVIEQAVPNLELGQWRLKLADGTWADCAKSVRLGPDEAVQWCATYTPRERPQKRSLSLSSLSSSSSSASSSPSLGSPS